jgi:polyhydroxybutyrate depolymerase
MVERNRSWQTKKLMVSHLAVLLVLLNAGSAPAQSGRNGVWNAGADTQSSSSTNTRGATTGQYGYQPRGAATPQYAGRQPAYPGRYAGRPGSAGNYGNRNVQPGTPAAGTAASHNSGYQFLDYNETLSGRKFTVHLPRSYNQAKPSPVVMVFHGLGMNGTSARALSAMDIPAESNGFITVYPDAIGGRWNDGVQRETGIDDVAFVSAMLDAISRKFRIDSRRVYACGISNGGYFVQRLACELSNRIAAIGVVAATASDAVCSRCAARRGMPVVFFLGTDDPLLPREGETKELGKLGEALGLSDLGIKNINPAAAKFAGVMTAAEAPEFWARNNNASAHARQEVLPDRDGRDGCKVSRETFGGSSEVVVYTIEGGGHSWPGGLGAVAQDILGRTTNDINASEIMWQFFQNHSR